MNPFFLRVETFAGVDIYECCREAVRLANQLQTIVRFKFNGVDCIAAPGDDPTALVDDWDKEMRSNHSFKLARARKE